MSQNEASSSATRPTFSPEFSPEISEAQKQAVDKCTNIIQEFRSGNISKPRATVLLQQTIPHVDTDEESFMSTYKSYFSILDNFEQYRSANLQQTFNSDLPELQELNRELPTNNLSKMSLQDCLSDSVHSRQKMKKMNFQRKHDLTSTSCHGMNQKTQVLNRQRSFLPRYKRPTLSSRISLGTSKELVLPSLTVANQSLNSLKPNGLTSLAEMPSTLITSFQTSTPYLTAPTTWLNLVRTSNSSMDLPHQPKPLRPMETGLLPGIAWSMPPCSSLDTGNKNFKLTESTSNATSPPYRLSTIAASSIMTEPFVSGQPNVETSSSQIFQDSTICKSSGSATQQDLPLVNPQSPRTRSKTKGAQKIDEALPVEDGMRIDAQMQLPAATTYISAQSALTQTTLPVVVTQRAKSEHRLSSIQWERRPRFVHEFVWSNEISRNITTAFITEKSPLVPKPPLNELMDIQKLNIIKNHPHLFHITTPIHINRFRNLLAAHPNRPLIDSVCEGLEHGFWPWAVTHESNAPPIVDNARLQKVRDPIHLLFIEEQRDNEIRQNRFSSAFDALFPGMTSIPLWVVPKCSESDLL
jgi:hypothetical protein